NLRSTRIQNSHCYAGRRVGIVVKKGGNPLACSATQRELRILSRDRCGYSDRCTIGGNGTGDVGCDIELECYSTCRRSKGVNNQLMDAGLGQKRHIRKSAGLATWDR